MPDRIRIGAAWLDARQVRPRCVPVVRRLDPERGRGWSPVLDRDAQMKLAPNCFEWFLAALVLVVAALAALAAWFGWRLQ